MPARKLSREETRLALLGPLPQETWPGALAAFGAFLVWAAAMWIVLLALGE